MKTIPLDTRERILLRYDAGLHTRAEVARLFCVSVDFVKKLLKQRNALGHVMPLDGRRGRKRVVTGAHEKRLRAAVARKPGATLKELHAPFAASFCVSTLNRALGRLGLTFKKKRCGRTSTGARTCAGRARTGSGTSPACPRNPLCSLTSRA
jgi:transposase